MVAHGGLEVVCWRLVAAMVMVMVFDDCFVPLPIPFPFAFANIANVCFLFVWCT